MKFSLDPIKTPSYVPIREEVFFMLREAILNGKLKPGDRLIERELVEQLGVSRTPIREALRKLELENLVTHVPRKGVFVSEISKGDVEEVLDIRANLEGLAAKMAVENITKYDLHRLKKLLKSMEDSVRESNIAQLNKLNHDFNQEILNIAGSPRLKGMINSLSDYISKFTRIGYSVPGRMETAMKQHIKLVEALASRNPEAARNIARAHVHDLKETILDNLDF